jgi:VCBS repeat protein
VDLDGDGRADVLSGSYLPGELYLWRGLESGFAPGTVLKDASANALRAGRASWPCAVDWERDGDLDLVIGNMYGKVFLALNGSSSKELRFGEPAPLLLAGAPLVLEETNATPCVADWDGDGAHDLLLGSGDGGVRFYRNEGAPRGEPVLAKPQTLLPPSADGEAAVRLAHPGIRARLAVCDWNADGRLDLLVGDHASESGPAPVLTAAEQKELAAAIQESFELGSRRGDLERAALARWLAAKHIAPARSAEVYDDFLLEWLASDEARAVTKRQEELTALQKRLNPALIEHGRVWCFLRRGK